MTVPAVIRERIVDADPILAFDVFTARIGSWWPLADLSVHGAGTTVAFVDGRIVESAEGKPDAIWGTVTGWYPPDRVAFTWHPGQMAEVASSVVVTFTGLEDGKTLVRLEHSDWEGYADPPAARAEYERGWPGVLVAYGEEVGRSADVWTWAALLHRPAVSDVAPGGVMADERFGAHVEFLQRMAAAGALVAAGPFDDEQGAGMTVLRLPGTGRYDELVRLATEDDASVASGFFSVQVRPWHVVLSIPAGQGGREWNPGVRGLWRGRPSSGRAGGW